MKRLICCAFCLVVVSLPVRGEEIPADSLHQPSLTGASQISATDTSFPQPVPDSVPGNATKNAADDAFRDRPSRMWPVYYHRSFSPEHERTIYGPLWLSEQDHDLTLNYPLWPISGVTRKGGRLEKLDIIWPLTTYEEKNGHTQFDLLWPITGFTHDAAPDRETHSLFLAWPLLGYYHGIERESGTPSVTGEQTGFFPFYYSSNKRRETFRYIFPSLLSGANLETGTNFHSLLPAYFSAERPSGSTLFILPTYLHIKNNERQLYSLLPFFHADKNEKRSTLYIFPSYFDSKSGDDTVSGLLPFYLTRNTESGTSSRYIFPTWFEHHREQYDSTWFIPFYTSIEDATEGSRVRNRTFLWPLYYDRSDEGEGSTTTSVLLNLYFRRTSSSASERYTSILWPFVSFGESPQYRLIRVWPYAYEQKTEDNFRSHYVLWPLIGFGFGDRESHVSVLPLFYHRSAPDRSFTTLLPFFLQKRTPESRFSLIFPVWYQSVAGENTENVLLNTWWSRNGEMSTFAFFPLYYRSSAAAGSQTQILNMWWESGDERSSFAFLPLYFRYTTPTESGNLLINTWWSGGERLDRFVFFPLAWYHSPVPSEVDFTFFPVFSYSYSGDERSTFSFLWRLYYQRHDQNGSMSAFLWWLYRTEERTDFRRLMCWPFIDYERNTGATDEVFTSILLHFMTYERNGERVRFKLFGLTLYES